MPVNVLLVEDNPGDARLIRLMLEISADRRFRLLPVQRLSEALCRLGSGDVDVILLDLNLPDSRGFETFAAVYERAVELPIVLLTGLDDQRLAFEAMRRGAQDYLVKDQVDGDILRRAINYAIERKRAEVALAVRLRYEEGLAACSHVLLTQPEVALALSRALDHLLGASKASRVCIFENTQDLDRGLCAQLQYEVCAAGVEALYDDPAFAALPYVDGFALWRERLSAGLVVHGTVEAPSDALPAHLQRYGIASILALPIRVAGTWYGFISFDDTLTPRVWNAEDIRLLRTAADMIGTYIRARRDAETKSALLREVNHRVKNNLSAIVGFLYVEQGRADYEDLPMYRSIVRELITRVQGLATAHSLLSASEWSPLLLVDLAMEVIRSALDMLGPDKRMEIDVRPSAVRISSDQAHHLALVINELTTNTVKHALQGRDCARIEVRAVRQGRNVRMEFRDDGPGYPDAVLRMEGHHVGFDLIGGIVRQNLHGTLMLDNAGGAVAIIEFPFKL